VTLDNPIISIISLLSALLIDYRSILVGLTISLDYWWTLRGLEEVALITQTFTCGWSLY